MNGRRSAGITVPDVAIVLGAIVFVALFLRVSLARIAYPFELEWMGGAMVDHMLRVVEGQPIYTAPTAEHAPFLYTPLQFWLAAALVGLGVDAGFLPMRLVSLAATVVAAALLFAFVRRRTGCRVPAFAALAIFAGGYFVLDTWYDTTRADSLCVALALAALTLLDRTERTTGAVLAGVVMVAAYFAKQTAFVLVLPFAIAAMTASPKRAGAFLATFALAWLLAIWAMDAATDGWFTFYTWTMPRRHGLMTGPLWTFWWLDLRSFWAALPVVAWLLVRRVRSGASRGAIRDGVLGLGFVGAGLLSRMHDGGAMNVLIPAVAGIALLTGLALGEALPRAERFARGVPWLVMIQVVMLGFDWGDGDARHRPALLRPARFLPTIEDRTVGERLVGLLRANDGDALVPRHGYLPRLAGKRPGAHEMAIIDLERSGEPELAMRVLGGLLERSAAPGVLIVVDEHVDAGAWPGLLRGEPLVAPDDLRFMPVIGLPTRPVVPLHRAP